MTYYYDMTGADGCYGILPGPGDQVVLTGVAVHREPGKYRHLGERFARECDFHFWFDDEGPEPGLYTVPMVTLGGYDSRGGLFAGIGDFTLGRGEALYYIDREGNCFRIGEESARLPEAGRSWQQTMTPTNAIELFPSREEAEKKYNIRVVKTREDILEGMRNQK